MAINETLNQIDRLKAQLQISGLAAKDFPLYQVINQLIASLRQSLGDANTAISDLTGVVGGIGTGLAGSGLTYITTGNEQPSLPNSRRIVAGGGIGINDDGQRVTIHSAVPLFEEREDYSEFAPVLPSSLTGPGIFSPNRIFYQRLAIQAIPTGTNTVVDWDTILYQSAGNTFTETAGVVTTGQSGGYFFGAVIALAVGAGTVRALTLQIGALFPAQFYVAPLPIGNAIAIATIFECLGTDNIQLIIYHDAGAPLNCVGSNTSLSITRLW